MGQQNANKKQVWKVILIVFALCFILYIFWYFVEVRPHVDKEVNSFVKQTQDIRDPQTKIKEIANFTEKDFDEAYNRPISPAILGSRFFFMFTQDPYFVAYFKAGACEESASLLNFYANKSGFESRIVGTPAEDHSWDEIKIDDRWVHVDPTIYYYAYTDPKNYSWYNDLWFNNTNAYSILNWHSGYSKIYVEGTNEDLTPKYCNVSAISVSCQNCNHIQIQSENGARLSIDQDMVDPNSTFTLGRKNYTITVDKNIIPFILVKESKVNVSLLESSNITIPVRSGKYSTLICFSIPFLCRNFDFCDLWNLLFCSWIS